MVAHKAIRYLHVIASLDPASGGPAECVIQLARAGLALGHTVEILTFDPPSPPWESGIGCPVHNLGPPRYGNYRHSSAALPWIIENAGRFDAIIDNGLWQHHGVVSREAARQTGAPYFVFTHGMLDPWFRRRYPAKHLKKYLYWLLAQYRILRDATGVLFTCEEEMRLARNSFRPYTAKEFVVPLGTAGPSGSDSATQRRMFEERFPSVVGKRVLLFLSRIHPKKGCDLLLQGFSTVARDYPDHVLVMAGPDELSWQAELVVLAEKLGIADRVLWTGMIAGDIKWGAYHAAEAFVLPSHSENFGIVVAEALACGKPVLISDKVNIWREISGEGAGLVYQDDAGSTGEMLRQWCALPGDARQTMSANAENLFKERFEIQAAARHLGHTLERAIGTVQASPPCSESMS